MGSPQPSSSREVVVFWMRLLCLPSRTRSQARSQELRCDRAQGAGPTHIMLASLCCLESFAVPCRTRAPPLCPYLVGGHRHADAGAAHQDAALRVPFTTSSATSAAKSDSPLTRRRTAPVDRLMAQRRYLIYQLLPELETRMVDPMEISSRTSEIIFPPQYTSVARPYKPVHDRKAQAFLHVGGGQDYVHVRKVQLP